MTGTPADDPEPPTTSRRSFVAGAGAGLTLGEFARRADGDDGPIGGLLDALRGDGSAPADDPDPHTLATYRALVDACIPRSPDLAAELGPEHEPGGLEVGVERFVIWFLNEYYEVPPVGGVEFEPDLAPPIAALLDAGAAELLARGGNAETPDPTRFPGGGPFASLAREDRFDALALLETHDVDSGRLPEPFPEYEGDLGYIVQGLHTFVNGGFYTEWEGYGDTGLAAPDDWRFTEAVTSWDQTDYPGPSRGYAAHRGYAVREFRENDWRDGGEEGDSGNGGGLPAPTEGTADGDDELAAGWGDVDA